VDEFEAIRLADFEGMSQREASVTMQISQPTFNRVLSSARSKIAKGLVQGDVLRIEGGRYLLEDGSGVLECIDCRHALDMKSDDMSFCPKCGSKNLRWNRWETEEQGPA
jgi:DNA-directed RNA polymerase subunit RPC12/RpoP